MAQAHSTQMIRRTQEQRSTEMQARLLDSTIDCLVAYGYVGTTTLRVAEKAGVTRGALIHHFRSKTDLVMAAITYLASKRTHAAMKKIDSFKNGDNLQKRILDLIWDVHSGPVFIATVELWVAGRTDSILAEQMRKFEPIVVSDILSLVTQYVPEKRQREARDFAYIAMDTIRGILVSSYVDSDPRRAKRRWDRAAGNLLKISSGF
ncbi:MAG: TetR/AcrR family transcriptional regulator [Mycobacteriaceae bacterium]